MAISNERSEHSIADQATTPLIRPATIDDIDAVLNLHMLAFNDKFRAAFGTRRIERGREALATAYKLQGQRSMAGMYLAQLGDRIVGTITLRTREMSGDDSLALERALTEVLGPWRTLRALFALSRLEHIIGRDEGYITDVAVDERYRRRGIARLMLNYVTEIARRNGKRYLGLYVSAANLAARNLYLSAGFTEEHVRRSWWNRWLLGESRWIYMRKVLT